MFTIKWFFCCFWQRAIRRSEPFFLLSPLHSSPFRPTYTFYFETVKGLSFHEGKVGYLSPLANVFFMSNENEREQRNSIEKKWKKVFGFIQFFYFDMNLIWFVKGSGNGRSWTLKVLPLILCRIVAFSMNLIHMRA